MHLVINYGRYNNKFNHNFNSDNLLETNILCSFTKSQNDSITSPNAIKDAPQQYASFTG